MRRIVARFVATGCYVRLNYAGNGHEWGNLNSCAMARCGFERTNAALFSSGYGQEC